MNFLRSVAVVEDGVEGRVDGSPLGEQSFEDLFAFAVDAVEALVAFFFLAPLRGEEALGFETPQEGVEGALVDFDAVFGEGFAQGVAVAFAAQGSEDGNDQGAAAKFEAEILEGVGYGLGRTHHVTYSV